MEQVVVKQEPGTLSSSSCGYKKPTQCSSAVHGLDCSRRVRSKSLWLNLPLPLCCCHDNKGHWHKRNGSMSFWVSCLLFCLPREKIRFEDFYIHDGYRGGDWTVVLASATANCWCPWSHLAAAGTLNRFIFFWWLLEECTEAQRSLRAEGTARTT